MLQPGNPYIRERLSTVDLLVLTSLDLLLLISRTLFFFTKHGDLIRRSTVLSLPLQLVFPALAIRVNYSTAMQGTNTLAYFCRVISDYKFLNDNGTCK
jgi:hypothetical protein